MRLFYGIRDLTVSSGLEMIPGNTFSEKFVPEHEDKVCAVIGFNWFGWKSTALLLKDTIQEEKTFEGFRFPLIQRHVLSVVPPDSVSGTKPTTASA